MIKEWAENKLERPLTEDEIDSIENNLEIYNEDDFDNIWCYSIGITEEAE